MSGASVVCVRPVQQQGVEFYYIVEASSAVAVQLWNGAMGERAARATLTLQPNGTWENSAGCAYTLEVVR